MFSKIEVDSESNDSKDPKYSVVLGLPFLSQYASTFNINTRSIALTPSKYSDYGVSLGKDPDLQDKPILSTKTILIILACVGAIILIGGICCCVEQYQKRKQLQEENLDASIMEIRDKRNRAGSDSSDSYGENINVRNLKNSPKHENPYQKASQGQPLAIAQTVSQKTDQKKRKIVASSDDSSDDKAGLDSGSDS